MSIDLVWRAFADRMRTESDRQLVISPSRRLTGGELLALASALSERLGKDGLEQRQLVGLAAPNGPAFLAGLLALGKLECPVLLFDWRTPLPEMDRIGRELGAVALVRCAGGWPGDEAEFECHFVERLAGVPHVPEGIGVVQLTSGSTGAPQGILKTSEQVAVDDEALARSMGLTPDERILASIPMSHAYGLSSVAMPGLMRGSLLVVPDEGNPLATMAAARHGDVTFLPTVPAYLQAVLKMRSPPPLPASLRLVITAGAPLHASTATRFRETYGRNVHVFYGASEVGGIAFDRDGTAAEKGTLGEPVHGVRISLTPWSGSEDPDQGIVTVHSGAVAVGYFPEASPALGDGRFVSSDLGTIRDGRLALLGRIDDLINVKGKKVRPGEVEEVLRELDGVEDVVVLGLPTPDGTGEMVRAVVACAAGRLDVAEVLAHCRRSLAAHKVPRGVVLARELPRNVRGKIDRAAVRALAAGGHDG